MVRVVRCERVRRSRVNRMSAHQRCGLLALLVEGVGVRASRRLTGHSQSAILRIYRDAGVVATWLHDALVHQVTTPIVQCDELHSFVGNRTRGTVWTWLAFDPQSKMVLHWYSGPRTRAAADAFFHGLRERVAGQPVVHTDNNDHYRTALKEHPLFRHQRVGKSGKTNATERMNLTIRTSLRRFTRRTLGWSKTIGSHRRALSTFLFWYNFARPHSSLGRRSPAQAAGLVQDLWTMEDFETATTAAFAAKPEGRIWQRIAEPHVPAVPSITQRWPLVIAPKAPDRPLTETEHPFDNPLVRFA